MIKRRGFIHSKLTARDFNPIRNLFLFTILLASCAPADPRLNGGPPAAQMTNVEGMPATQVKPPAEPSPGNGPIIQFPADSELAAVAFEDRHPLAGDEDFNDFMSDFRILEKINDQHQITDIFIEFYPRAVGASYDHSLLLLLSGQKDQPSNINLRTKPLFNGGATVTLTHYDEANNPIGKTETVFADHDIVVFKSTHALFDTDSSHWHQVINTVATQPYKPALQSARVSIHLNEPEQNPFNVNGKIDPSKFRMVLHVMHNPTDVQHDIDIVDVDPTNSSLFDQDGYPYGFIIPANWRWPTEDYGPNHTKKIDAAYPNFSKYREYLLRRSTDPTFEATEDVLKWFNEPGVAEYLYPAVPTPKLLPLPVF